ncbi:MAG: hypothetical protein U0Q18_13425 [Bryobacteraceae bacterium]
MDSLLFFRLGVIASCLALAGCTLHARKQAATPPPPRTPAVQPRPQPEQPLSALQTVVDLPTPQPISPDAVPHSPELIKPPENVQGTQTVLATKPKKLPSSQSKTTSEAPSEQLSPDPGSAAPAPEDQPAPEQGLFQTILSDGERKKLQQNIEQRDREIDERLAKAGAVKPPSDHDKGLLERISSYRQLSKEAESRGDLTQADALSDRALVLAKELQVE